MSRIALIKDGVVDNVIEAELEWAQGVFCDSHDEVRECESAGPGWLLEDGELVPPPRPDPQDPGDSGDMPMTQPSFMLRFTLAERIAAKSSGDSIIIDGMAMFEIAEDARVDDPDTVAVVNYLASVGIIAPSRVAEILTP